MNNGMKMKTDDNSGVSHLMKKNKVEVVMSEATLPAKGKGLGQVQVSVSGRLKVITAASNGKEIAAFADVKVVEARDDGTLIVEPLK